MALVLRAAFLPCLYILLYAFLAASFTSFNAASARWRFFIYQKTPAAVAPNTEAVMMILFMTNEFLVQKQNGNARARKTQRNVVGNYFYTDLLTVKYRCGQYATELPV